MSINRVCWLQFSVKSPCLSTAMFSVKSPFVLLLMFAVKRPCVWMLMSSGKRPCVSTVMFSFKGPFGSAFFIVRGRVYWYSYFLASKPRNSFASLLHVVFFALYPLTSLSLICWILWCKEESRERYEVQRAELPTLVRRNVWERKQRASKTTRHDPSVCTSHHITLPFI
jgi:hypothetical protein